MIDKPKSKQGGKRAGAGRKARFGIRMIPKTIFLPREWIDQLVAEFGSLQEAIRALVSRHISK